MSVRRDKRLTTRGEISQILKNGQSWECPFFSIKYAGSNNPTRCAVLVSRKHGNAVQRNRIKRVLFEVFRILDKSEQPFFDILLLPRLGKEIQVTSCSKSFLEWQAKNYPQG